jgi:DNA-binding CsgD family transcriptional regulator
MGAALPSLVRWGLSPDADLVYRTLVSLDTAREGQLAHELGLSHDRVREAVRELAAIGAIRRVSSTSRRTPKATGRAVWAARQPNQVVGHLHIHRPRAFRIPMPEDPVGTAGGRLIDGGSPACGPLDAVPAPVQPVPEPGPGPRGEIRPAAAGARAADDGLDAAVPRDAAARSGEVGTVGVPGAKPAPPTTVPRPTTTVTAVPGPAGTSRREEPVEPVRAVRPVVTAELAVAAGRSDERTARSAGQSRSAEQGRSAERTARSAERGTGDTAPALAGAVLGRGADALPAAAAQGATGERPEREPARPAGRTPPAQRPPSWQSMDLNGRRTGSANEPPGDGPPQVTLTPRERAIVELLAQGHTDETAARELDLSRRTVGYALGGLMSRLGVDNRFQLGLALGALRAAVPIPRRK